MTFDKTRENIKADSLDDRTRKELFRKFVDHGGEVLDERQKKRALVIDRERQKELIRQEEEKRRRRREEWQSAQKENSSAGAGRPAIDESSDGSRSFFNRLRISFHSWIKGVGPFSGQLYSNKFIRSLDGEVRNAVSGLNVFFIEYTRGNPRHSKDIIAALDARNAIYYEVLEKSGNIYDMHDFVRFSEILRKYGNDPIPVTSVEKEVKLLFRKLYLLRNYSNSITTAIDLVGKFMSGVESAQAGEHTRRKRKAQNDLTLIFTKTFPQLYWAFLKIQDRFIELEDPLIEVLLEVRPEEYPGNRNLQENPDSSKAESQNPNGSIDSESDGEKRKSEENQQNEEQKNEEKIRALPKGIQIGLNIMKGLPPERLRRKYDIKNRYDLLPLSDKVFLTYLLFKEFDHEFSFVLTTNRLKLNQDFSSGVRKDYHQILNDIFQMSHDIYDQFEHYYKLIQEIATLKLTHPSQAAYIQHTKRITELENKRIAGARNVRNLVREMMEKTGENLEILIRDIKGAKKIVENPEDILTFDPSIEGQKKLNQHTLGHAIQYCYAFASGFRYRLTDQGDLYGGVLELEKDLFGNILIQEEEVATKASHKTDSAPPEKNEKPVDTDGTISDSLDELGFS